MRVGEVTHPHHFHNSQHPSLMAAASHQAFSRAAGIAGQIAAGGASLTASPPASQTKTLNADLQAYTDLAEIQMYILQNPTYANYYTNNTYLMGLISDLGNQKQLCDPDVQALITQAQSYYTVLGNTDVQFSPTSSTNNSPAFTTWWQTANTGGLAQVMQGITTHFANNPAYQPSVATGPNTPGVLVNLCMIYADAMLAPNAESLNLDSNFWSSFGSIFPAAVAVYAYQKEFYEPGGQKSWAAVDADITSIFAHLPNPANYSNFSNFTNYDNMYNAFNTLQSADINSFASPAFPSQFALFFQDNPTAPSEQDIFNFYGNVLDTAYNAFMNPS
jgi:hypothetical protein